jgi:hypothetical protein
MKTKLFSAFAASELLSRDRQTIARALRNIPPDGKARGAPRWKMSTIFEAMERHNRANEGGNGSSNGNRGRNRLGDIADELEQLHQELDAAITLVRSLPDLDKKQPHSRAAAQLIQRIDLLYTEANELLEKEDAHSLAPHVTPTIVGTYFRLLLAAVYGAKGKIDGERIFTDDQIKQFNLA